MAKVKKKRTKKYQGSEAAISRPKVTRVSAVSRRPLHQWLYDRRRLLKAVGVIAGLAAAVALIIVGIASLF